MSRIRLKINYILLYRYRGGESQSFYSYGPDTKSTLRFNMQEHLICIGGTGLISSIAWVLEYIARIDHEQCHGSLQTPKLIAKSLSCTCVVRFALSILLCHLPTC